MSNTRQPTTEAPTSDAVWFTTTEEQYVDVHTCMDRHSRTKGFVTEAVGGWLAVPYTYKDILYFDCLTAAKAYILGYEEHPPD